MAVISERYSMTKKQTIRLIAFLLTFIIILIPLTYVLRTSGEIKDLFNGFYSEPRNTIDLVVIGSSPVYPGFSAPKLYGDMGITSYPLSSNVQRPSATLPLVKEAVKYQSPDMFIFEMRMYTMEDGRMAENMAYSRGVTDNLRYSINRIDAINRLIPDSRDWEELLKEDVNESLKRSDLEPRYSYYFDIFKYHSNWALLFHPDQLACALYNKPNPLKGYSIRNEVGPLSEAETPMYFDITEAIPIPQKQEERLRELLAYLKDNNLKAMFVVFPYDVNDEAMKMFNYMNSIISAEGYEFINMNMNYPEIGIDYRTDYDDYGGHLNTLGSSKVMDYLEILLPEYELPDHRGNSQYTSWDQSYEFYSQEADAAIEKILTDYENGIWTKRNSDE